MIKKLLKKRKKKKEPTKTFKEYMYPNMDSDELLKALREWEKDPSSHPALEKWYEENYKDMEW